MIEAERIYSLYVHTFPNGKKYIGIAKNCKDRWGVGGKGYKSQFVYKYIKKYGWKNIKHEVIYENLLQQEANAKEKFWIKYYKTTDINYGYNKAKGGSNHKIHYWSYIQYKDDKIVNIFVTAEKARKFFNVTDDTLKHWCVEKKNICGYTFQRVKTQNLKQFLSFNGENTRRGYTKKLKINNEYVIDADEWQKEKNSNLRKSIMNSPKCHTPKEISYYTEDGKYLGTFDSIKRLERELLGGKHIARKPIQKSYGYILKVGSDCCDLTDEELYYLCNRGKNVKLLFGNDPNFILKEYRSIADCRNELGLTVYEMDKILTQSRALNIEDVVDLNNKHKEEDKIIDYILSRNVDIEYLKNKLDRGI